MKTVRQLLERRRQRVRFQIRKKATGRLRLSVFRSAQHIYAQIIDDAKGHTMAAVSTLDKDLRPSLKSPSNADAAKVAGLLLAKKAKAAGIDTVVFDRGGYLFHGRVKALAEGAREGGLLF
ncbi:MAG: 50S ribosomal protein L18 [Pseudomonadota bacterium]|nr:50S ribosomal protein L18 [Pseudomonadota bacterium]